jgi:hypothetical protein
MNDPRNEFTKRDQRLLDLLVDGELAEAQRRELLLALDNKPDGWRRCALAFLEAQSWGWEMHRVAREPAHMAALAAPPIAVAHKERAHWNVRGIYLPMAMAASFLLAFVLGLAMRPPTNRIVDDGPDSANPMHVADGTSVRKDTVELADGPHPSDITQSDEQTTGRWGTVKLAVERGPDGALREVNLPAVETDSIDESWLTGSPTTIPPQLQQLFERLGHQVRQERELLPVRLDDGRQMIIPVDKVRFTPMGNQAYQ